MNNDVDHLIEGIDELSVSKIHSCAPELTNTFLKHPNRYLKVLSQNIRSINRNFQHLQTLMHRISCDSDLVVLTECWLACSNNFYLPMLQNYTMLKTSKHLNQSDGVVVYFKSDLHVTYEEPDFSQTASGLIIKIKSEVAILCIYRSPSSNIHDFILALNNILSLLSTFKTVIITGDLNIDIKSTTTDTRSLEYLNCLASQGFLPAHTLPTRGNNCLDHLILKTKCPCISFVYDTSVTDHHSSLLCLEKQRERTVFMPSITRIDYEALDKSISQIDFSDILCTQDVNTATDNLIDLLATAISNNTSVKQVPARKRLLKPWITPGLLRCIRHRDALHRKLQLSPDNEVIKITYKRYRNFCSGLLKKAKRTFDTQELDIASHNPKALWETIKKITNTTNSTKSPKQLLICASTPEESCNVVNSFFVSIGRTLADHICNDITLQSASLPQTQQTSIPLTSFVLEATDPDEIMSIIGSLRSTAATGWDTISPLFLKKYAKTLAPILCHIFNLCFETSVFPTSMKKAIIHPIFKGGDGKIPSNYRPIAVLSALSKILERLINRRLTKYLERYNLLSPQQFGFRKNKSTCDAVQDVTSNVVLHLNQNKKALTVFLDLAKAFDTVPITTLLLKLESVGVRGATLDLFRSYLSDRSQTVRIDNYSSEELPINYGVPQGSILGPTLFLIFINDLCNLNIPYGRIVAFADDTAITFTADTWSELELIAQHGLNTVLDWLTAHTLTLNTTKTKFLTYSISAASQPHTAINLKAHSCLTKTSCNCPSLENVDHIKYLGILLDQNLNFKTHINLLTSRVRKLIYIFRTLRYVANFKIIRTVYFALCSSIITYCISCWGGTAKTILMPLEVAHRAILKVATFRHFMFPTNELYSHWGILNLRQYFILQVILLQHKKTPYIKITKRRKDKICSLPRTRSPFFKRFFYYQGPALYNKINKHSPIYGLSYYNCKKAAHSFLQGKNYDETEKFLTDLN